MKEKISKHVEKLARLESLTYFGGGIGKGESEFVAKFTDRWLRSETPDIIECLKVIKEIDSEL
ncbi:MAG: hypothetical protein QXG10_02240 [Candidatus Hadarchaeales archaeon]